MCTKIAVKQSLSYFTVPVSLYRYLMDSQILFIKRDDSFSANTSILLL